LWENVGRCIRQFHRAGVWHADLNARNILLNEELKVFLVDFDRARLMNGTEVNGKRNLERLKRSLQKLWPEGQRKLLQPAWNRLLAAYHV
jgi:3-deoxy-D-manno-octulosonic acid kinase